MFTTLLLVFYSYYKFLNQWISLTNAWLWPPQTFQNPQIKIFDQIDIKEQGTIFHIFSGGNLSYIYITLRIAAKTFHYFNATMLYRKLMQNKTKWLHIFFWNFHHVYLTGKRTALAISWPQLFFDTSKIEAKAIDWLNGLIFCTAAVWFFFVKVLL